MLATAWVVDDLPTFLLTFEAPLVVHLRWAWMGLHRHQ